MKIYNEDGIIDSDIQDILSELGNVGLGSASILLGRIVGLRLHINVPEIHPLSDELIHKLSINPKDKVGILVNFQETLSGCMLFVLETDFADEILKRFCDDDEIVANPIEKELVLQEFGNLLTGAYLKAISRYSELRIFVSPADILKGSEVALLGSALARTQDCGKIIFVATSFSVRYEDDTERENVGRVIILPDEASVEKLSAVLYD